MPSNKKAAANKSVNDASPAPASAASVTSATQVKNEKPNKKTGSNLKQEALSNVNVVDVATPSAPTNLTGDTEAQLSNVASPQDSVLQNIVDKVNTLTASFTKALTHEADGPGHRSSFRTEFGKFFCRAQFGSATTPQALDCCPNAQPCAYLPLG